MKLRILVENQNHVMLLGQLALKDKQLAWDLADAVETAIEKFKKYIKMRDELIIKHGAKIKDTEDYQVKPENDKAFQAEYDKLVDVDVVIKFPTVSLDDLPAEGITVNNIRAWKNMKILVKNKVVPKK